MKKALEILRNPKAADPAHVKQNRAALDISLTQEDLNDLERDFPAPIGVSPLAVL